jgi:hypothetical protein
LIPPASSVVARDVLVEGSNLAQLSPPAHASQRPAHDSNTYNKIDSRH